MTIESLERLVTVLEIVGTGTPLLLLVLGGVLIYYRTSRKTICPGLSISTRELAQIRRDPSNERPFLWHLRAYLGKKYVTHWHLAHIRNFLYLNGITHDTWTDPLDAKAAILRRRQEEEVGVVISPDPIILQDIAGGTEEERPEENPKPRSPWFDRIDDDWFE